MNTENTLIKLVKKYEAKTDALSKCAAKKQRITELEAQLRVAPVTQNRTIRRKARDETCDCRKALSGAGYS